MESLKAHYSKSLNYLKLGDKEDWIGSFISWEAILTKFGKKGYRFTLEREDGSRLSWDTGNGNAIQQISDMIDKGLEKGDKIKIHREGIEKDNTKYTITEEPSF